MLVVVVLAIRANIIHNCVPAGNFSHLFNPSGNYRRGFFSASAVVLFLKYSVRYVLIVFEPVTAEVHTHKKHPNPKPVRMRSMEWSQVSDKCDSGRIA